jgi:hypothetical protein
MKTKPRTYKLTKTIMPENTISCSKISNMQNISVEKRQEKDFYFKVKLPDGTEKKMSLRRFNLHIHPDTSAEKASRMFTHGALLIPNDVLKLL